MSFLPYAGLLARTPGLAEAPPLVVADPAGDLPRARAEGQAVAALTGGRLLAGSAAGRAAVLGALDGARLLHFAGHGVLHTPSAWDAHLGLADDTTLTIADLFAARPRIGVAVLSGCETGRERALGGAEAIGLPAALLAAGARAVLATDRPIPDGAARRLLLRFYEAGGATAPGPAWRAAVADAVADGDEIHAAFRLWGHP